MATVGVVAISAVGSHSAHTLAPFDGAGAVLTIVLARDVGKIPTSVAAADGAPHDTESRRLAVLLNDLPTENFTRVARGNELFGTGHDFFDRMLVGGNWEVVVRLGRH